MRTETVRSSLHKLKLPVLEDIFQLGMTQRYAFDDRLSLAVELPHNILGLNRTMNDLQKTRASAGAQTLENRRSHLLAAQVAQNLEQLTCDLDGVLSSRWIISPQRPTILVTGDKCYKNANGK